MTPVRRAAAVARGAGLLALALLAGACGKGPRTSVAVPPGAIMAAAPAERDYTAIVVSEAVDEVSFIRFGPAGASVVRQHRIGLHRADPDGPHGVAVSPDGSHYYVTTGHGTPNGLLWKLRTEDSQVVGRVELGLFPASLQLSPDGRWAYVVNFNLHGEMEPSSVSIVSTAQMVEVARLTTCTMPHGSRMNPQGTRHYSACMMDDVLVEIDTREFEVARHFMLTPGSEHGMPGAPGAHRMRPTLGHEPGEPVHPPDSPPPAQRTRPGQQAGQQQQAGHGQHGGAAADTAGPGAAGAAGASAAGCSPTWAVSSADGARVFVACTASNDIVEVDVERWTLVRRIPAGDGVYNLETSPDGRLLVATNKRGQSVSVFETTSGRELARIATTRRIVHGVAISADSRYAFVSVEGIGSEPGTVEVIDLRALVRVAAVDVGQMAGGIDLLPPQH